MSPFDRRVEICGVGVENGVIGVKKGLWVEGRGLMATSHP